MAWRNGNVGENVYGKQVRHVITFQKAPDTLYSPGPDGLLIGGPGWLSNYVDSVNFAKATARLLTEQMWATFGNSDEHLEVFDPE